MERSISPDSILMLKSAQTAGITLAFAEVQSGVRDWITRYELFEEAAQSRWYRSVNEAAEAYLREREGREPDPVA